MDYLVGEAEAGVRLDQALAALVDISRSQARRWIDAGRVTLNASPCAASTKVVQGDVISADAPEVRDSPLIPQEIPVPVLFEDADVVVVDKPAGLVVHPAPGHPDGTLVNALLHHCGDLAGVGGVLRPGIVHRLDRGTSGVMVVAKHDAAHRALAEQFHDHTVDRTYFALVRGTPREESGHIDRPIGRHARDRKRMSVAARVSREARTNWRVERRFRVSDRSWLEVKPETGRTHQIRVHLASVGLPLVGDPVYGRKGKTATESQLGRPALHAAVLGFAHPTHGERLRFEAALPEDLARLLGALGRREPAT